MSLSITYLERRHGDSPSIERVFRCIAKHLRELSIESTFVRAPFGNSIRSTVLNLVGFRPKETGLLHITGHINYMALVLPVDRTILTVHDLTVLEHRKGFRRWLIKKLYFEWPARRLRYLTAISVETKKKLADTAGIDPSKIVVIENPLLVDRFDRSSDFNKERPTILQIGTAPNKNLVRLIEALKGIDCTLWIVGKIDQLALKKLTDYKVSFRNDEHLEDSEIIAAYGSSDIVTLCSTGEGFGLPIIEAQAMGTPVVTSDLDPMRAVAGGGAALVDPNDVGSIREGILNVINDSDFRRTNIEKGFENVKRFAPEMIAAKYARFYRTIIGRE